MNEATNKTIALNGHLKPSESSAHDELHERRRSPGDCRCRFRLHRASLACRDRQDREGWPGRAKRIGGTLVTCVAMGGCACASAPADTADLGNVRDARQSKPNT